MKEAGLQIVGRLLATARRVLFITGAGVSAESGIPTFRGATGVYSRGSPEEGMPIEEILSGRTLASNPALSWKYFFQLELALRGKQPNAAHRAIKDLETAGREVWVATQNIDGLHQEAGSTRVIELHGNLRRLVCTRCSYRATPPTFEHLPSLPLCPLCGAVVRPDAVLYEEMLPEQALGLFESEQSKGFDLVFSVGTTSIFHYVVAPLLMAGNQGVATVEINPEETTISELVSFRFPSAAGPTLRKLCDYANAHAAS